MGKREVKAPKALEGFDVGGERGRAARRARGTAAVARPRPAPRPPRAPNPRRCALRTPTDSQRRRSKRERQVYRLLRAADVRPALLAQEVHILWPDDGVWYLAVIEKVGPGRRARARGGAVAGAGAGGRPD
jgi:hypothetical protein